MRSGRGVREYKAESPEDQLESFAVPFSFPICASSFLKFHF
jgi:hypothetical protein